MVLALARTTAATLCLNRRLLRQAPQDHLNNMRKSLVLSLLASLALLSTPAAQAQAQAIVIKLGTSAPQGSPWHKLLKEAAQGWDNISSGRVKLKIFAGGTMGNEGDMVTKMKLGQLQSAALTSIGLHEITPEPMVLDLPMFLETREQKESILAVYAPKLEAALLAKGYVVLNWSEIGFVRFFSTQSRNTLAKMQAGKLFVWDGDPASAAAWKAGGFNSVVLSATDIIPSMQTGLIDTVAYPPAVALAIRLNDKAKYMSDLKWSSLTGAMVVTKKAWDQVPPELRPSLLKVARQLGQQTVQDARKTEDDSIAKMKMQGLTEVTISDKPAWRKKVEDTYGVIRGKVVPEGTFDEVLKLVMDYRAAHGGK